MAPPVVSASSSAAVVARFLKARGVDRVFALCGGHIMPLWMRCDAEGIRIIDVRDERAAVHMAHAHAELTGGLGVALVTAGPGVTNAMTGIANAHVSRAPVLVLSGVVPRQQENRGALQDMVHTDLLRSITRYARTVREPSLVVQELDEAVSRAFGEGGEPGPVYLDFPTDTLRAEVGPRQQAEEHLRPKRAATLFPDPAAVRAAADLLWSAKRPLVISGRGARAAGPELVRLLDAAGAVYLDTGESRGLVPDEHPSVIAAMRGSVMGEADLVVTVGRRLDFQLAYGSASVFCNAQWLRIADAASELRDNRRGTVELFASPSAALAALVEAGRGRQPAVDRAWARALRQKHEERAAKLRETMRNAPDGKDGRMHPNKLLAALQEVLPKDAIVVADGGDFLSFARVALPATTYLDPGPFGCIGVGVPFGIAASLAFPARTVVVATGDGSFGFNAIELDTAVRHGAKPLFVVANNGAWQIEVHDQTETYGKVVGTKLQTSDYAALARAFGMHGERVERAADLPAALERAMARRPALLDVLVATDAVSADGKSGLAWVPDLMPLAAWDEAERKWRDG
ncbi:MAG TPA: thiamine pyrophosphate-binding protein [Myxococcales bacterium]